MSLNGGIEQSSIVVVDKEQSYIHYGLVRKTKQVGKLGCTEEEEQCSLLVRFIL